MTETRQLPASRRPATAAEPAEPKFQPVRPRRAFEAVCEQIRRQVADGLLLPGHRLPGERELAEEFDISRSAVRQALRNLELAGIVQSRTGVNGGFFIKNGGSDGIAQAVRDMVGLGQVPTASVMEARIELTNVAIRLACERGSEEEFDAIAADIAAHAELFRLGQGSRTNASVSEFYRLVARATHNEVIEMLVDALSEIVRTFTARIDPKPNENMISARSRVLRYMRARDADRACAVMTKHLRHVSDYIEAQRVAGLADAGPSAR
ncbi:GntR family transcriptional regulator [Piscinibacter sakaiensis]|uniref:Transcriptional regulator, GntR family n=1 Tax=Piscinibacter sakaiensis TaxID=1547922 RepID=A0A0K8P6A7_PISS1|nr:GntR family transcriptional regulator [Piscinibacter sakaiensis]GAP38137.1 transcriptional regulator, GntR family [Piscinibacter sakaiensis]